VIFFDPVAGLPDAYSAAKKQPLNWYFKRQLLKNGEEQPAPLADAARWIVASDAEAGRQLIQAPTAAQFRELPEAMLQVLGGYVVAIPSLWNSNRPVEMPNTEAGIERDLNWACDVYEALSVAGGAPAVAAAPRRAVAAASVADALMEPRSARAVAPVAAAPMEPAQAPPPRRAYKPRSALQIVAGLFGLLLLGGGLLGFFGVLALNAKAEGAKSWPTVEGRMVSAEVAERGGPQFSARVRYTYEVSGERYEGDKLTLATTEWLDDRAAIEAVVAQRQPGSPAKVYYNPKSPKEAVLEPRMADAGIGAFVMFVSAAMVLVSIALLYAGIRRAPLAA
jgi:hypothetical protein